MAEDTDSETSPVGFVGFARKGAGQPGGSLSDPRLEEVLDIRGRGFEGTLATTSSWGWIGWA